MYNIDLYGIFGVLLRIDLLFNIKYRMDLRQLRYFVAVADHGNFHRASEALHVAQSALSRHMRILGEDLGGPLFERVAGGVRVTPLGQVFYIEAKSVLERADSAVERTRKAVSGEIGQLVIGVNELGARHPRVTRCIVAFRERYPEIELAFERMYSNEQIEGLQSGKLDLGILGERPADMNVLEHLPLDVDQFLVAMPEGHPLADKAELEPEDLTKEPFVGVRISRYAQWQAAQLAACRAVGFIPRIVQEAVNEQMQLSLIRSGLGIGFVNRSVSETSSIGLVLRPPRGINVAFDLDLAWLRDNRSPAVRRLVSVFREKIGPIEPLALG